MSLVLFSGMKRRANVANVSTVVGSVCRKSVMMLNAVQKMK